MSNLESQLSKITVYKRKLNLDKNGRVIQS